MGRINRLMDMNPGKFRRKIQLKKEWKIKTFIISLKKYLKQ